VQPLYPVNGGLWNDWVANDGADAHSASDTACAYAAAQVAPRGACLHAGELRAVAVGGVTDCAGLTATDQLDRFDWVCVPGTPVRMVSFGLKGTAGLSALLDLNAAQPAFHTNAVTVRRGTESATTAASTWWANAIVVPTAGGTLTNATGATNTIFAVTSQVTHSYELAAAETSLVVKQGAAIRGQSSPVVSTSANGPVWVEGFIETTAGNGLYLVDAPFSTVRNLEVNGTNAALERCHHATVRNLRVHDGNPGNVDFTGDAMLVEDVIVERQGATNVSGINIDTTRTTSAQPSVYRRLRATAGQQNGVFVHAGPVWLRDVVASDNRSVGLQVNGDQVRLQNVVANHNGSRGLQIEGSYVAVVNANAIGNGHTNIGPNGVSVGGAADDNLYVGILSASNHGHGISAMGYTTRGSSIWAASTVVDNQGDGFGIAAASHTISNIVSANNGVGNSNVGARMSASGWLIHNLAVANNSLSLQVDLNMDNPNSGIRPTLFTGNLQVTVASPTGSCSRVPPPYSLRGIDNLCANNGTTLPDGGLQLSHAVLSQTGLPWWTFAGPLATAGSAFPNQGDLANPSDGLAPTTEAATAPRSALGSSRWWRYRSPCPTAAPSRRPRRRPCSSSTRPRSMAAVRRCRTGRAPTSGARPRRHRKAR